MSEDHETAYDVVVGAYRRILENAKTGKGVRLSAEEVEAIAHWDHAVQAVVLHDEFERQEAEAGPP